MELRFAIDMLVISVILANMGTLISAQSKCGTLTYRFIDQRARIRMSPVPKLIENNNTLVLGRTFRWMTEKNGVYTDVKIQDRVTAVDFILYIDDFGPFDVATYYVQCRNLMGQQIESDRIYVARPNGIVTQSVTSSTVKPTTAGQTTEEVTSKVTTAKEITTTVGLGSPLDQSKDADLEGIDSSIAIIIVSTCVVIIVVVISGTIILVCRRRKQQAEDHQRLKEMTMTESSVAMACRMEADGESSVYNEIDITYDSNLSKGRVKELSASREHLRSPTLPRRPVTPGQSHLHDKPHSGSRDLDPNRGPSKENVYSDGPEKEEKPKDDPGLTVDVRSMYSTVVPKKYRINKDDTLPPEYINARYSVMFPKIDMSTISTNMDANANRAALVSMTEENFDAVCKGGVYRSQKRKSSRKLNYVEIDHSGACADSKDDVIIRDFVVTPRPHEKLEYSSIDFEKKAFVAPTRRPPSSWYKRRNKKKRY